MALTARIHGLRFTFRKLKTLRSLSMQHRKRVWSGRTQGCSEISHRGWTVRVQTDSSLFFSPRWSPKCGHAIVIQPAPFTKTGAKLGGGAGRGTCTRQQGILRPREGRNPGRRLQPAGSGPILSEEASPRKNVSSLNRFYGRGSVVIQHGRLFPEQSQVGV